MVLHPPIFFTRNQQKYKHHQAESSYISIQLYISILKKSSIPYCISLKSFSEARKSWKTSSDSTPPKATHLKATSPNRCSSSLQAWLGEGRTSLRPLVHKQPPADLRAHPQHKIQGHGWKATSPTWLGNAKSSNYKNCWFIFSNFHWLSLLICDETANLDSEVWSDVPFLSRLKVTTQLDS